AFSLFSISSLIFWVVNAIVHFSSMKKALHNLFLLLFPLSSLSVLASITATNPECHHSLSSSIAAHVTLSILAYSLLTIASLQALILAYQTHALKHKNRIANARLLPPLQTMESLLFELLWVGEILLTLAILSGFYFLEDMFAQHLVHKTVFALIAWFIYALLLWDRHQMGWRGNKATRWALAGFICLMLAYFGTKMVFELFLDRIYVFIFFADCFRVYFHALPLPHHQNYYILALNDIIFLASSQTPRHLQSRLPVR